jgi:hypothetical protein
MDKRVTIVIGGRAFGKTAAIKKLAFDQGVAAAQDYGNGLDGQGELMMMPKCPHQYGSEAFKAWHKGWHSIHPKQGPIKINL